MSKSKQKIDNNHQSSIFDFLRDISKPEPTREGQSNIYIQLQGVMRPAIKACPLSVHQIAGEMSHLVGETITAEMIYSWTRESDQANGRPRRHIPAEYLPAFCQVTGSNEPLKLMGQLVGLFVLPGPEALRAEIQKLDEKIQATKAKKRKRLMFLREMEQK
ncbi:MAG: hypothetical protein SV375_14370 [Thermodesulfobacteriota bacterium]|nr:hypothetical protein [Thermodesulfobacteriota bacterium]